MCAFVSTMGLRLISLILIVGTVAIQALAAPPRKEAPLTVNVCNNLLGLGGRAAPISCPLASCKKVYELFDAGLEDEAQIQAYVGISYYQLIALLKTGEINASMQPLKPFTIQNLSHRNASALAFTEAPVRHAMDLVIERVRYLTGKTPVADQALVEQFHKMIFLLISQNTAKENKLRLTFEDILRSLGETIGEDIGPVHQQKLRELLRWLNLPLQDIDKSGSINQSFFMTLFANLSAKDGFVIGVNKINPTKIQLQDIVGIDPMSDQGFQLLRNLNGQGK